MAVSVDRQPVELQQIHPKSDEKEHANEDLSKGQVDSASPDADHPEPEPESKEADQQQQQEPEQQQPQEPEQQQPSQEPEQQQPSQEPEQQQPSQEPDALRSTWNGLRLYIQTWTPDTPRAILYLSHGTGEHMGRYEKVGALLAENGFLVYGHDHVGHGRSEGERVYVETMDTYAFDVIKHVEIMKKQYPDLPSLIMGHSMGGLVALSVALKRPELFIGLVLSSSMVEIDPASAGAFTQFLARVLGVVLPHVGVKPIDPNYISSLPEEVKLYKDDPLIFHDSLPAKWVSAAIKGIKQIREHVREVQLPVFIMHGTDDHLVPFSASQFIFDNIGTPTDKTFETFEGSYHEILHDKDQERARELIKDWLLNHLTVQTTPTQQEEKPPEE